jgi:hypothetical protein
MGRLQNLSDSKRQHVQKTKSAIRTRSALSGSVSRSVVASQQITVTICVSTLILNKNQLYGYYQYFLSTPQLSTPFWQIAQNIADLNIKD